MRMSNFVDKYECLHNTCLEDAQLHVLLMGEKFDMTFVLQPGIDDSNHKCVVENIHVPVPRLHAASQEYTATRLPCL